MSTITKITIDEYMQMIERGEFSGPNHRRVELIEGDLREMSPSGWLHAFVVDVLTRWSVETVGLDQAIVRIQGPVEIAKFSSVPQPDVLWLAVRKYWPRPPEPKDVLLLIEVSESTLAYDQGDKARLYAKAGIKDYWIVNIPDRFVEVYREPRRGQFRSVETFDIGEEVRPLAFPDAVLEVASLFPAE